MKDLKYYKEIFCSSELELYFMSRNTLWHQNPLAT